MNYNLGTLECCECNTPFSCRVGQSNQRTANYHLICKECESGAEITLIAEAFDNIDFKFNGVSRSEQEPSYHIDLHLDFPVKYSDSRPVLTPFMSSVQRYGHERVNQHGAMTIRQYEAVAVSPVRIGRIVL